jgi:hypothetical protein
MVEVWWEKKAGERGSTRLDDRSKASYFCCASGTRERLARLQNTCTLLVTVTSKSIGGRLAKMSTSVLFPTQKWRLFVQSRRRGRSEGKRKGITERARKPSPRTRLVLLVRQPSLRVSCGSSKRKRDMMTIFVCKSRSSRPLITE